MRKDFARLFCWGLLLLGVIAVWQPSAEAAEWFWLNSDAKYTKYFEPDTVKVVHKAVTKHGDMPTEIEGWTKTTYSYGGAADTIKSYGLQSLLPNPNMLSYSLALLRINPQNRTIQYAREDFYDSSGKIIWSKTDGRVKEINSQSFDEEFYTAIVDEVFRHGETKRRLAEDRWITLWEHTAANGITTTATADTTTMRMKGANLIVWEWEESKNSSGGVTEIKFMKKSVNLAQGTERIIMADRWVAKVGWTDFVDEYSGKYRMIEEKAPDYKGLERLRAFAKGYSTWVNRYSIES
ncbi:MAG: hypothetical protein IKN33_07585 [Selenomonadaceae bacterium]|nr:hypothetical protein [Selenomonadaceae bacterium]